MRLERRCHLWGHTGSILTCAFAGSYVLAGGLDRKVVLYNVDRVGDKGRATLVHEFVGHHRYEVVELAVAKEHDKFACCCRDSVAYMWDVASCQMTRKLFGHSEHISSVCLNDASSLVLTGSNDRTVRIYDLRSKNRDGIQTIDVFRDNVTCVRSIGTDIFVSCADGRLFTFDVRRGKSFQDTLGQSLSYLSVSSEWQGSILVGCVDPGAVCLLDTKSGKVLNEYCGHQNKHNRIPCGWTQAVSSAGTSTDLVCAGSECGKLFFWDLEGASVVHKEQVHSGPVSCLAASPKGNKIVSCGYDGSAEVLQLLQE